MKFLGLGTLFFLTGCAHSDVASVKLDHAPLPKAAEEVNLIFDEVPSSRPLHFHKMESLQMSASGTFGTAGAKYLSQVAPVIVVMDLRQEAHGLINGKPVTWSSERNTANLGMTVDEVLQREKRLLSEIHIGQKIGKAKDKAKVKSVETEESLLRSQGQTYVRLAVTDHLRPTDSQVDRFIEAVQNMPPGSWIHFHDQSGKGRATIFMLMYDMLRSAENTDYDSIIRRVIPASEDPDVLTVPSTDDWRFSYQKEQIAFIKEFYNYAKAHPRGQGRWWSQWAQ